MNVDQLFRWKLGARVNRYHTHGLIRPPSVDQHQWGVAVIALYLEPELSRNALIKALVHDLGEYDTGDVPAFVKRSNPELRKQLKEVEFKVERRIGTDFVVTEIEERIIKLADLFDHIWTCLDEVERGNSGSVISMFFRGVIQINRYLRDYFTAYTGHKEPICLGHNEIGVKASRLLGDLQRRFRDHIGSEKFATFRDRAERGEDYFIQNGDTAEVPKEAYDAPHQ